MPPPGETGGNRPFSVAGVLQSNMVIQRDKPIKIWGNAKSGSIITVNTSWNNTAAVATTSYEGVWEVIFPATVANASPQNIVVATPGEATVKLVNI